MTGTGFGTDAQGLARWERMGLEVRLALRPRQPGAVQDWIGLGLRLADAGLVPELPLLRRMLRLLLQVAHDEALPWFWRSLCLELAAQPLARLLVPLDLHDPPHAEALRALIDVARTRLEAVPIGQRRPFTGPA